jgi:predicted PurR-regulated permease PerM
MPAYFSAVTAVSHRSGHAASTHLGPVHSWMAHHGVPPGATSAMLVVLFVVVLILIARAILKSVFS